MAGLKTPRDAGRGSILRWFALIPSWILSLWAFTAVILDFHSWWKISVLLAAVVLLGWLLLKTRFGWVQALVWVGLLTVVVIWWLSLRPQQEGDWQVDVSRLPWSERHGDHVTLHEIRNFSYRTPDDYDPHWETRTVDLAQLQGVDVFLTHWGVPLVAHAIVSFRFNDGTFLATSIEARKTKQQTYSVIRGFFRQFQLIILLADERDVVRLRTNYRAHENVYAYRTRLTPADTRTLFEAYLTWMNDARVTPRWYNAVTQNCGSAPLAFLAQEKIGGITRTDLRGLLAGEGDKMLYDLGDLQGDTLSFDDLKRQALINDAAHAADTDPDFSQRIRAGRAGFSEMPSPSAAK